MSKSQKTEQPALTVGQVAGLIRGALVESLPGKVRVVGEISNLTKRSHWFFSLKDEAAAIRCVCFASAARRVRFDAADGMEVVATGRIDFYDASGQVQLYVDGLEPVGQGALEMRFQALCEQLRGQGYFEVDHKKALPAFVRRVAVVTSRTGAALQDVINTARGRWAGCALDLVDVRVQGDAAAGEVARSIDGLSKHGKSLGIDAVIVTRGGGSIEDLWAFNERVVADAIYKCRLPVVAAIGHETDTTIAELVADVRCATPTQAAMTVVPDRGAYTDQVGQLERRLGALVERQCRVGRERLRAVSGHPVFARPGRLAALAGERVDRLGEQLGAALRDRVSGARDRVNGYQHRLAGIEPRSLVRLARQRLEHEQSRLMSAGRQKIGPWSERVLQMSRRLSGGMGVCVRREQDRLAALGKQLEAVGPRNVLQRGYSYTLTDQGQVVRGAEQVGVGDQIVTVLGEGQINSEVLASETGSEPAGGLKTKQKVNTKKPSKKRRVRDNGGPGLFDG